MLTVEEMNQIVVDLLREQPPSIKGKEADKFRIKVKKDIAEIQARGLQVELPFEWQNTQGE